MATNDSLVCVLTPVYNGEAYLRECIDSVLAQTHRNFRYIIVDNCSTDGSLQIAEDAATRDDRVSVVRGTEHVGVIQNWNRALAAYDPDSKYVKYVHADDWLFPDCVRRMVEVADANESVGLVSAYRLEENRVSLDHLPSAAPLVPGADTFTMNGRDVARAILLERASVLGSPSSVLMRTAVLGDPAEFYDTSFLHADKDAALRLFRDHDFGFVRQVLVFTRRHNESVTSMTNTLDTRRQENLLFLRAHGPSFLSEDELDEATRRELRSYYHFLARNLGTGKSADFWRSHEANLARAGTRLNRLRLIPEFLRLWLNPLLAFRELRSDRARSDNRDEKKVTGFLEMSRTGAAKGGDPSPRRSSVVKE